MDLVFEQHITGGDRNFGYLIGLRSSKKAVLIDPSYNPDMLVERARVQGMEVVLVFNTHSHSDHTNGNDAVGVKVAAHESAPTKKQISLKDGQELDQAGLHFQIIHVPGHCNDHIVIYLPMLQVAFTGDHLFVGKIGGTGTEEQAREQYESFEKLKVQLAPEATIWPGHDVGARPASTLAIELLSNPFLTVSTFEEFYALKNHWSQFKAEKGLI